MSHEGMWIARARRHLRAEMLFSQRQPAAPATARQCSPTMLLALTAGLAALKATTVAQVKRALPALEEQIDMDPEAFHDFCTFAFKFCLTVRGLLCNSCVD